MVFVPGMPSPSAMPGVDYVQPDVVKGEIPLTADGSRSQSSPGFHGQLKNAPLP